MWTHPTRAVSTGARCVTGLNSAYSLTAQVALHIAAVKNNHRIARMLIAARASVNRPFANGDFFKSKTLHYGGTILGFACVNSDFELFEMLMEAGVLICALVGVTQQSSELLDVHISLALCSPHAPLFGRSCAECVRCQARPSMWLISSATLCCTSVLCISDTISSNISSQNTKQKLRNTCMFRMHMASPLCCWLHAPATTRYSSKSKWCCCRCSHLLDRAAQLIARALLMLIDLSCRRPVARSFGSLAMS